ncbi:MAG TPA: hypothetical protein VHM66_00435 [Solirubrobacterales bacterium]|nr:hypothetical protein [Solirubrobacterales bacterium]
MRPTTPLAIAVLAAALLAGCGGSSSSDSGSTSTGSGTAPKSGDSTAPIGASAQSCDTHAVAVKSLRATGVSCSQARQLMFGWQRNPACASPQGASRSSCTTRSYRCLGTTTSRGLAVSCSRPGHSVAFIAKRG